MIIYAIRHGLTELNNQNVLNGRIDEPLIPEGIEQAKQITPSIPESIKHIYASPMIRTRQTVKIINSGRKLPVSFHDELKEVNFGLFTGKSWKDLKSGEALKAKHRTVQYDYRPEGESVEDVKNRVLSFLKRTLEYHTGGEILIVTHGGIIRVLQLLESGLPSLPMNQIKNTFLYSFDLKKVLNNNDLRSI